MSPIRTFEEHTPEIDPQAWLDPTCLVIGDVHIGAVYQRLARGGDPR